MTPKFYGTVQAGKLTLSDEKRFKEYLHSLGGKVELVVKKYRASRSNEQNRYYWGVVIKLLSEHTGYDEEEMHEAMKIKFLLKEVIIDGVPMLPTVNSTSKLNTAEFEEYAAKIRMFASQELGVFIPLPNEIDF